MVWFNATKIYTNLEITLNQGYVLCGAHEFAANQNIMAPMAWRERQLPFFGMRKLLWLLEMLESPSIFTSKHL